MKKFFITFFFCVGTLFTFSTNPHTIDVKVDIEKSTIYWKGSKINSYHDGYVKLRSAFLVLDHGKLAGGQFIIDLNTITNSDIKKKKKADYLVSHLKNEDFFDVSNYPMATLIITEVEHIDGFNYTITADLTIKDKKHPIVFNASIPIKGAQFEATAKLSIDRTKWGVIYNSGNFIKDLAANKIIKDEIEFEIQLFSQKIR